MNRWIPLLRPYFWGGVTLGWGWLIIVLTTHASSQKLRILRASFFWGGYLRKRLGAATEVHRGGYVRFFVDWRCGLISWVVSFLKRKNLGTNKDDILVGVRVLGGFWIDYTRITMISNRFPWYDIIACIEFLGIDDLNSLVEILQL